jgi:hypothetical protein
MPGSRDWPHPHPHPHPSLFFDFFIYLFLWHSTGHVNSLHVRGREIKVDLDNKYYFIWITQTKEILDKYLNESDMPYSRRINAMHIEPRNRT